MKSRERFLSENILKFNDYEYHSIGSATEFAMNEFKKYNLNDWKFMVITSNKKSNIGCCHHYENLITMQARFFFTVPKEEVEETILHEIAHALSGPGKGHGAEWKKWCKVVGCVPKATKYLAGVPGYNHDWIWYHNTKTREFLTQEKIYKIYGPTKDEVTAPSEKAVKLYTYVINNNLTDRYFLNTRAIEWGITETSLWRKKQLELCKIHHNKIFCKK